jgi:hypothetical protein
MNKQVLAWVWGAACVAVLASGCEPAVTEVDDGDFARGAFPPTLSDTEYHQRAWSRPTCLSCHEHGLEDAPEIRHASLPDRAKLVKCRTCHVLVRGNSPSR